MKRSKASREITIEGYVTPVDWNEEDEVLAVSLVTDDGEEYFVEMDEIGEELLELTDEEVEASGVVRLDKDDNNLIKITTYSVMDRKDEYDEDEYYDEEEEDR